MNIKKLIIVILLGVVGLSSQPSAAKDAGFLDFFFPSLRKYDEDPTKTLRAPFAYKTGEEKEGESAEFLVPSADNTVPLHRQHRINEEIVRWLELKIPELLKFRKGEYETTLEAVRQYFDESAWRQYLAFHDQFGLRRVLVSGDHATSSFVESPPIVLTQDTIDDRYAWLLRTPVTISFFQGDTTNYKDLKVYNQNVSITAQLGRRLDVPPPGVIIERWEVKQNEK